jgi:deoxycytidylate deaminase
MNSQRELSEDTLKYLDEEASEEGDYFSHDEETKVGAVTFVNRSPEITYYRPEIIFAASNRFICGAPDKALPKTRPDKYRYMIHAERNLIALCSKNGIGTKDLSMFVTLSPCEDCIRMAYQAGINIIYFRDEYRDFHKNNSALDFKMDLTKIGKYTKIVVSPRTGDSNE